MIRVTDTYNRLANVFENSRFQIENWKSYMNEIYPGCAKLFLDDMTEYTQSGEYTFEKDFLPILDAVYQNPCLEQLHENFLQVTEGLDAKVKECFGRALDVDVVLYLGLCNGAGWVTEVNGRTAVLLGVEKILELAWYDVDSMRGLIYHELGHVYQNQYGVLLQESEDSRKNFVWQLFTEGIAMYFEQRLVGDTDYFHQNKDGWRNWCEEHMQQIKQDFHKELPTMTRFNQRYFGDWARYEGHGDVGYYLGNKFIHLLLEQYEFHEIITFGIEKVWELYEIQNDCSRLR